MLLPYTEQTPLYNAANFSWACCWDGQYDAINSTVYSTKINSFLCPSDGLAGIGSVVSYTANINSYAGSIGTTTIQYPNDGNTSGIFKLYNPNTNAGLSVTLAEVTDGTSNTIAFGEGLVGDNSKTNNYRGNGMSGASRQRHGRDAVRREGQPRGGPPGPPILQHVLGQRHAHRRHHGPQAVYRAGLGPGRTRLDLVQHGRAAQLEELSLAQLPVGRLPGVRPGRFQLRQRQQQPPGRGELRVRRREREVPQGLDQYGGLRVARHPGRRRGRSAPIAIERGAARSFDPPAGLVEIARRGRPRRFRASRRGRSGVPLLG